MPAFWPTSFRFQPATQTPETRASTVILFRIAYTRFGRLIFMTEAQGWITPLVRNSVYCLTWPSKKIIGYGSGGEDEVQEAASNAKRVDTFVAICALLSLLSFAVLTQASANRTVRWFGILFCVWRVIDISATAARMTLFKFSFEPNAAVASHVRVIVLGLVNYLELSVCFAVFYSAIPCYIHVPSPEASDWFAPLYFSAVTQLTIGYGDLYPVGPARAIAVVQAFVGVILIVLLVARFISVMKPIRSVSLTEGAGDAARKP
jgi:hypothetical protein